MKPAVTHGLVWYLSGKQTLGQHTAAGLRCRGRPRHTLQCTGCLHSARAAASLSRNLLLSRDRRSDDYITTSHLATCLWRMRSHALVMQTMRLCGLLYACSCVTITNRIANTWKLNSISNL